MATPQNYRALQLEGQSYDGGNTNSQTVTLPIAPTPTTANLTVPLVASLGYTLADITPLQQFLGSALQSPVGEVLARNQSPYWLTVTFSANSGITGQTSGAVTGTATTNSFQIGLPPYGLWIVPTNCLALLTSITGGFFLDANQPVPPTTTTLYMDIVYWS